MRYEAAESGRGKWGEVFYQLYKGLFPDELGAAAVAQGLLVAPGRKRRVKIPAGTPAKPELKQQRQSRITTALATADPKFSYRPAKPDYPDIGVKFDRMEAAESWAGRGLDSRPSLKNARKRKTAIPLSDLKPLEPTHRLVDLREPFGTVAVALSAGPSEFKLASLTNSDGGLGFESLQNYYRDLAAGRQQAETESTPSADSYPEIPWLK